MTVETIVIGTAVAVNIITVVGVAMKLSARFTKVEVLLNHVIENDLHSIRSEISALREFIINHITKSNPSP
ncbi:hypothetical protein LCGC14_0592930 [marine sediment metagenome]|uniref:Uncharacterized protein n=1 Tax=marine sediment metagenome TaxID=412755 RepID=A0A0F9RCY4_9ZZZZ